MKDKAATFTTEYTETSELKPVYVGATFMAPRASTFAKTTADKLMNRAPAIN